MTSYNPGDIVETICTTDFFKKGEKAKLVKYHDNRYWTADFTMNGYYKGKGKWLIVEKEFCRCNPNSRKRKAMYEPDYVFHYIEDYLYTFLKKRYCSKEELIDICMRVISRYEAKCKQR